MEKIYIGTSGYSYPDWKGIYYPDNIRPENYLEYYSRTFNFVELNFSYYRMPEAGALEKMAAAVPENFLFTVKGHKSITHERGNNREYQVDVFTENLMVLCEKNCLGGILLQFPYSFHYTKENRIYLGAICSRMESFPLFVEFRNSFWDTPGVISELESRKIGLVNPDLPKLKNLPTGNLNTTTEDLYIRFHGRNSTQWWTGNNISRYDYLYSDNELTEKAEEITALKTRPKRIFIAFNNHYKGQAVKNAEKMCGLLNISPGKV